MTYGRSFSFKVEVDSAGIDDLNRKVQTLTEWGDRFDAPTVLTPAVIVFGRMWRANWHSQGGTSGQRWQPLAETTKRIKQERGFGGRPTLEQTTSLRSAAIDQFANWGMSMGGSIRHVKPSAGGGVSGGAIIATQVMPKSVKIVGSGEKIAHMTGGNIMPSSVSRFGGRMGNMYQAYGVGNLPARPFWYVNHDLVEKAASITATIQFGLLQSQLGGQGGPINTRIDALLAGRGI